MYETDELIVSDQFGPDVALTLNEEYGIRAALYRTWALRAGAAHFWTNGWATDVNEFPDFGGPSLRASTRAQDRRLCRSVRRSGNSHSAPGG